MQLNSKTILLTGATRGIGRVLTRRFAEQGHVVCGCGRSVEGVARLRLEHSEPHNFDVVDVSVDEQVEAWIQRVVQEHGAPDLVLNNAALINRTAPLWEISAREFSDVVDVNVKGVASVIRYVVPAMAERGSGVIVNLSSGWGRSTSPGEAPYCATKWAIEGLTKALAQELPRGLAAIALSPGTVNTEMLQTCMGESAQAHADPDEWSHGASSYILGLGSADNGASLSVN